MIRDRVALTASDSGKQPVLLADDLTGACDAGVAFLQAGWRVEVAIRPELPLPSTDLAVVSTNTRALAPSAAAAVCRDTVQGVLGAGRTLVYKKLDSTLHGNPGAEIDALLSARPGTIALICPAFPAMGRRLRHGELILGEDRSPTGRNLAAQIEQQTQRAVASLNHEVLTWPRQALAGEIERLQQRGASMLVFDAESEAELANLATLAAALTAAERALPCGSTGLARHFAIAWHATLRSGAITGFDQACSADSENRLAGTATRDPASPEPPTPGFRQPKAHHAVLCIIGSTNRVTQRQIEALVAEDAARVVCANEVHIDVIENLLDRRQPVVLKLNLASVSGVCLREIAVRIQARRRCAGVVLSGGDTALHVCGAWDVRGIELLGDVELGVPRGRLVGGLLHGLGVVTKAGGFGDAETLRRCARALAQG
jgi:uncharacterized protein YgbK (DUF1537 family)